MASQSSSQVSQSVIKSRLLPLQSGRRISPSGTEGVSTETQHTSEVLGISKVGLHDCLEDRLRDVHLQCRASGQL